MSTNYIYLVQVSVTPVSLLFRVGIDVGGTFTDIYGVDSEGKTYGCKVSTTPEDLTTGVMNAIKAAEIDLLKVNHVIHGTTITNNTLIQRSYYGWYPKVAMITTEGFRDNIEIGRWKHQYLYDPYQTKPGQVNPLIKRRYRFTIPERIGSKGEVLREFDEDKARELARRIREIGAHSVAVFFIHAYKNPAHELRMRDILREYLPNTYVALSSETRPKIREHGRVCTTAIRAVLLPIMERYLSKLERRLEEKGFKGRLFIIRSDGGMMTAEEARRSPEETLWSGPAVGVVGGRTVGLQAGHKNIITEDMGGTTWLVSIAEGGNILQTTEFEIEFDIPVTLPMIDVRGIGAGGGSIAWIDAGGSLRVGPQSAGASPGPACYGRGGTEPTVTDANLLLGRIDPTLGGKVKLDTGLARKAVGKLMKSLNLDIYQASAGIIAIVCENMAFATKMVTFDRGRDPRDFVPVVFGGAGPMHACSVAESLGIPRVVIAANAGLTSALGAIVLPIRHDIECTYYAELDSLNLDELNRRYEELEEKIMKKLEEAGISEKEINITRVAEMRYVGQQYEVAIVVPNGDIGRKELDQITESFHRAHEKEFCSFSKEFSLAFVNLRVVGEGRPWKVDLRRFPKARDGSDTAIREKRSVYFENEFIETNIYDWNRLTYDHNLDGPAVVEMPNSCAVIPPGWAGVLDEFKNLELHRS